MKMIKKIGIIVSQCENTLDNFLGLVALSETLRHFGYEPSYLSLDHEFKYRKRLRSSFFAFCKDASTKILKLSEKPKPNSQSFLDDLNKYLPVQKIGCFSEFVFVSRNYQELLCLNTDSIPQIFPSFRLSNRSFLDDKTIFYNLDSSSIKKLVLTGRQPFLHVSTCIAKKGNNMISNFPQVVSPIFLLTSEQWRDFVSLSHPCINKRMARNIFCYFEGNNAAGRKSSASLSREFSLPLIDFSPKKAWNNDSNGKRADYDPFEVLGNLFQATIVCTDSPAIVSLCLIFHIRFYCFATKKRGRNKEANFESLSVLINKSGTKKPLDNRRNIKKTFNEKDFRVLDQFLSHERTQSCNFLTTTIANIEKERRDNKIVSVSNQLTLCSGCGACKLVCPKNAISIISSPNGFYQSKVDASKCIGCSQCLNVCPFLNVNSVSYSKILSLSSFQSTDEKASSKSSSGSASYEISRLLSNSGYTIIGSHYDENNDCATHIVIPPHQVSKLSLIQGSKYLQSRTDLVFQSISETPKEEKIAFFGTPCQVAALKNIADASGRKNMVFIDLVCHGVPSSLIWKQYLLYIEERYGIAKNPFVIFRRTDIDWRNFHIWISDGKNVYLHERSQDLFYSFFDRQLDYMPSCYDCPFRNKSSADLRLGDFWSASFIQQQKATSLILSFTQKGEELRKSLQGRMEFFNDKKYIENSEEYPTIPLFYDEMFSCLKEKGLIKTYKRFSMPFSKNDRIKNRFSHTLKMLQHKK